MASGGYDYEFIPKLPTDLECVICHLALKKPIQLEACGHQFCECCFNDMKNHVAVGNEMQCPIDRQVFNHNEVFKDKATERTILNWKVECQNKYRGCCWIGEFNTVERHTEECNTRLNEINSIKENVLGVKRHLDQIDDEISTGVLKEIKTNIKRLKRSNTVLEESNGELKNKLSSEIMALKKVNRTLGDSIIELKNEFATRFANPSVTGPDDLRMLITLSDSKWEWKCPVFSQRGVGQFSPLFYYKKWCFRIWIQFEDDDYNENKLLLYLGRCRGLFDKPDTLIKSNFQNQVQLSIKHVDGHFDTLEISDNLWIIESGKTGSKGRGGYLKHGFNYIVNGFYNIFCKIIEKKDKQPDRKRFKK